MNSADTVQREIICQNSRLSEGGTVSIRAGHDDEAEETRKAEDAEIRLFSPTMLQALSQTRAR